MQPIIFNPAAPNNNNEQYTETAPFEFCNSELQKTTKEKATGIKVTFQDGAKGFYSKKQISNWNML